VRGEQRELGQVTVQFDRPAQRLVQVPGVGDELHHVPGEPRVAGHLAPRHPHRGGQPLVRLPRREHARAGLGVHPRPGVVGDAVHERPDGEPVAALADDPDPQGAAHDVGEQRPHVELRAGRGPVQALGPHRRDHGGRLRGGAGVDGTRVDGGRGVLGLGEVGVHGVLLLPFGDSVRRRSSRHNLTSTVMICGGLPGGAMLGG
jgi:hypothetical protein